MLAEPDSAARRETRAAAAWALDEILKLLHPFMPFITEELWGVTAGQKQPRERMLALTEWPDHPGFETDVAPDEPDMNVVFDAVTETRAIRTTYGIPPRDELTINLSNFTPSNTTNLTSNSASIARLTHSTVQVNGLPIVRWDVTTNTIQNLTTANSGAAGAMPITSFVIQSPVKEGNLSITMPTSFDVQTERARLAKEMAKCDADIARVDQKLGNADFLKRAPEDVVEGEREKREEAQARREKLAEALERLQGAA